MVEDEATRLVGALRARDVMAHVHRASVYKFGVRVVIGDGREAIWDSDGAAGLEATVMRDNMLVGFVPLIPGSESYDEEQQVDAIASAVYD